MNKNIFIIITSFFFGCLATYICLYIPTIRLLNDTIIRNEIMENDDSIRSAGMNIYNATMIRQGREKELLKKLETKILPLNIRLLKFHRGKLSADYMLWRIKKHQEEFSLEFPEDIISILDATPESRPPYSGAIAENTMSDTNTSDVIPTPPQPFPRRE